MKPSPPAPLAMVMPAVVLVHGAQQQLVGAEEGSRFTGGSGSTLASAVMMPRKCQVPFFF